MTNQQKFIDTFGQEAFDTLMSDSNLLSIDILKWFMKEYESTDISKKLATAIFTPPEEPADPQVTVWEEGKEDQPKKRGGGKPGRKMYDSRWYEDTVEDFYLGSERTKNFTLTDDPSLKPLKTMDGLKCRFENAVKALHVEDCVVVHKYYAGTVNECIVLENIRNPKAFKSSYKLS